MAATATATMGSSFSTANYTSRSYPSSTNNKLLSIPEPLLVKFGYATKTPHSPLVSHSQLYYGTEPLSIGSLPHMWRAPLRLAAAMVASEEAVVKGTTEEAEVEEELTQVEAENGDNDQIQGEVPAVNTKLYFGNLPYHCDSAQLAGIVQQYGTPELVEVLYDRDTGRSRGFAFVTMSCVEDCNAVIENLDGSEYGGRFLRVNFSDKPKKREPLYPETEHKLFVGNLSWSVTSESLYQAFQEYGNVVGARVLYDGETGKSRGYGFVCYSTRSEMENALASLNGVELEGRGIRVSLAEGKKS